MTRIIRWLKNHMADQCFLENIDLTRKLVKIAFVVVFVGILASYVVLKNVID